GSDLRRLPPTSLLCPYTTLFRSHALGHEDDAVLLAPLVPALEPFHHRIQIIGSLRNQDGLRPIGQTRPQGDVPGIPSHHFHDIGDRKSTRLNSSHVKIS